VGYACAFNSPRLRPLTHFSRCADELRFDVRLLQRVPYEGISRMQTSLRRRHRDRVVRRGIGMTIEVTLPRMRSVAHHCSYPSAPFAVRFLRHGSGKAAFHGPAHVDPLRKCPFPNPQKRPHAHLFLCRLQCVQETCNFDCLFSYLTCGNYDFRYDIQKGLRPRRSVRTAMAHEIMFYAIVQKEDLGFDKAVEEAKARMSRYSVKPNMCGDQP